MHNSLLNSLTTRIDRLPADGVFEALRHQCCQLEEDWAHHRIPSADEAISIECFYFFLKAARTGQAVPYLAHLPPAYLQFFRRTVGRLMDAAELPADAGPQFDKTFYVARDFPGEFISNIPRRFSFDS